MLLSTQLHSTPLHSMAPSHEDVQIDDQAGLGLRILDLRLRIWDSGCFFRDRI